MSLAHLHIDSTFLEDNQNDIIIAQLKDANGHGAFVFRFPMCRNHSDIAVYYLEAAFVGQLLYSLDNNVSYTEKPDNHYDLLYIYSFKVNSYEKMNEVLDTLRSLLSDDCMEKPIDDLEDFRDRCGKQRVAFPDLVDSYFANELGSSYDWVDDYRDDIYSEHPEWAYHCWLSASSPECAYPLYVSPNFWLMPSGVNFRTALEVASDIDAKNINLEVVQSRFVFENTIYLLGNGKTALISELLHMQTLEVASIVFPLEYDHISVYLSRLPEIHHFYISGNMDFLVCEGSTFTYILFRGDFSFATTKQLKYIRNSAEGWIKGFSAQAGLLFEYKCDWTLLNDETFELLCYDLTRRDGRFPPSRVKKMGHSKSRDGGRDIIAYTATRLGSSPKEWLIQCKYSSTKKSLGRNSIQLSELIDEYMPAGIIVATNLIVDAGLHDKSKSISENRSIEVEVWDGLEIERRVNQNPDLYKLYFVSRA